MRYRDRRQTAETLDQLDHGRAEQADAIPQHVARWSSYKKCALADRETRADADTDELPIVAERREMRGLHPLNCRPPLPGRRHILPLV